MQHIFTENYFMLIFSVDPEQNVPMENHERGISPLLRTLIIHNYQMGTIITVRKFNLVFATYLCAPPHMVRNLNNKAPFGVN